MNESELPVDETVEGALSALVLASRGDPTLRNAVRVVDEAVRSLRERNTRLARMRLQSEIASDRVRALCDTADGNTLGRHVHGGGVLPAVLSTAVVRAALDGES